MDKFVRTQGGEMARNNQPDLFETDTQAELFDEDAPPVLYYANPDRVRVRLHKILAEARAAQTMPWDAKQTRLYRTIFPQMTNWLPDDEAAQLRFEFEAELVRLAV
jgi:tRNA nucleotidyltransferase/poly(A) polymerase